MLGLSLVPQNHMVLKVLRQGFPRETWSIRGPPQMFPWPRAQFNGCQDHLNEDVGVLKHQRRFNLHLVIIRHTID